MTRGLTGHFSIGGDSSINLGILMRTLFITCLTGDKKGLELGNKGGSNSSTGMTLVFIFFNVSGSP